MSYPRVYKPYMKEEPKVYEINLFGIVVVYYGEWNQVRTTGEGLGWMGMWKDMMKMWTAKTKKGNICIVEAETKKEIEYELKQIDTKEKLSELIIDDIKYRQQEDKK